MTRKSSAVVIATVFTLFEAIQNTTGLVNQREFGMYFWPWSWVLEADSGTLGGCFGRLLEFVLRGLRIFLGKFSASSV